MLYRARLPSCVRRNFPGLASAPPPAARAPAQCSPSLSMPTRRHLVKRQAWQALRLRLVISHSLEAGQLYSMLPARKRRGLNGGLAGPRRQESPGSPPQGVRESRGARGGAGTGLWTGGS